MSPNKVREHAPIRVRFAYQSRFSADDRQGRSDFATNTAWVLQSSRNRIAESRECLAWTRIALASTKKAIQTSGEKIAETDELLRERGGGTVSAT